MTLASSRSFEITEGTASPEEEELILLGTRQDGDPDALRVLVHPDAENWPPISYQRNPDRTSFLFNGVLHPPKTQTVETESSTGVIRFDRTIADMVIEERWLGGERRASVETWFFSLLLEYLMNPPAISYTAQTYIQWQPRDHGADLAYNIVLMSLSVGGGGQMWVVNLVPPQGDIGGGMQDSDVPGSGVLLEEMVLSFKIVSLVT